MAKLAVWSVEARTAENGSQESEPKKVLPSSVGMERYLEDWIVKDASLIGEGLTLVGRQVTIDDGRLDLLAIDSQDRWVVIEVKPDELTAGALTQALAYAASLARLDATELRGKLDNQFTELKKLADVSGGHFSDRQAFSERVKQQVESEGDEREIAVMLVGAGIHPGLERMSEYLERFQIPINIVSFEVFQPEAGPKLLVREVIEEPADSRLPKRICTVKAIRDRAEEAGVVEAFDRFIRMSEEAELAVQPQRASIRIAPPQDRRRCLMYVQPFKNANGAGLWISVEAPQFARFFPKIGEQRTTEALGSESKGSYLTGNELEQRLNQIESFLTQHFPIADATEI